LLTRVLSKDRNNRHFFRVSEDECQQDSLISGGISMKALTATTLCILATVVTSGVALAAAASSSTKVGKEEQAFRKALRGP
jgi:hypothetical protein